jgi:Arc/MetJ-type ribon-helix-helix transcriptional regulator
LERFVHEAVLAGRYASAEDVVRDALMRLEQMVTGDKGTGDQKSTPAGSPDEDVLIDRLNQQLLAEGLVLELPDPTQDVDDDDPEDQPIEIAGEPLSETIIRERR